MEVLALFNQKGGVGKTSIASNLAACFASRDLNTLIVDLDSQANTSHYVGESSPTPRKTISDFFEGTLGLGLFSNGLTDMVQTTPTRNLSLIACDGRLIELQAKLEQRYKVFKLREALKSLAEKTPFEVIVLDCPPALNIYSMSALMAATQVFIPFDCDTFAIQGLKDVCRVVEEIKEDHNPSLRIGGVIANQVIPGAKQPIQALKMVEDIGLTVLMPYLSSSIVMKESHQARQPLITYKPKHKLTKEFIELSSLIFPTAAQGANSNQDKKKPTLRGKRESTLREGSV